MATTIAEPVIRLNMNNAKFIKGVASTQNRWREMWRTMNKATRAGTNRNNAIIVRSISVAKLALGGFLSFVAVSIFSKMLQIVRDSFRAITDAVVKGGAEMESGLVEVNKAANLTGEQIKTLRDNFLDFSDKAPVTVAQLLKIAAAGARMGLTLDESGNTVADATQRLTDFAKIVAKTDVAIEELGTEELAQGLGRLLTLFKLNISETKNLASALNSAAQSANTTADQILRATVRSAGAAKQFKFTAAEALAVSTTLLELGRTAEITGSSFEKLLNKIADPTKLKDFGDFLGITADQFEELVEKSPLEAIEAIFKAFGQFDTIFETEKALKKLFGTDIRVKGSLRALAQGTSLLTKNLNVARKAFAEGTSVEEEFAKAADTVNSRWKVLTQIFSNAGKRVFPLIRDTLVESIDTLSDFGKELGQIGKDVDFINFVKDLIRDVTGLTVAFGRLTSKFIRSFFKEFGKGADVGFIKGLTKLIDGLTDSIRPETLSAFTNALKLALVFAKLLIGAFVDISRVMLETIGFVNRWVAKLTGVDSLFTLIFNSVGRLKDILKDLFTFDESRLRALKDTFSALADFVKVKFQNAIFGGFEKEIAGAESRLDAALARLTKGKEEEKPKKIEVKKEAKEKKQEEVKEEEKEKERRKPTIFVSTDLANELEESFKKRAKEAIRSPAAKEFFRRGAAGIEQAGEKSEETFAKSGIREFKIEGGTKGQFRRSEALEDANIAMQIKQEEIAKAKAESLRRMEANIKAATEELNAQEAAEIASGRLAEAAVRFSRSNAGTRPRASRGQ